MGLSEHHLRGLDDGACILLLGSFVRAVALGDNINKLPNMSPDTINLYMVSAHRFLEVVLNRQIDIMDPHHKGKRPRHHPFLGQQISDRRRWYKPNERYEPFTMEMFEALQRWIATDPDPSLVFFSKVHATYDWTRLGLFTGFRIGEYGQSQTEPGQPFARIPNEPEVPEEYRGMPLAMMAQDFVFYDRNYVRIPHLTLASRHARQEVIWVEICWRYDKSAHNFTRKKYRATGHPIFCPVDAAVKIIHRAALLGVPANEPIGVWSEDTSSYRFIHARDVTSVMRTSVDLAYPDPQHYMRINRHRVVPHSNRVTAAVALFKAGASNDEIAFKLRWHPNSVPTYLRACFHSLGDMLESYITGALQLTFAPSA